MPNDQPTSPSPQQLARLHAAASHAPVHHEFVEQYARRWLPDPERGQVWRLAYGDHAALALVWAPGPTTVSVLPLSEDPEYRDAHTVVFTDTPLHVPIGVWISLEAQVPTWSLDRCLGRLGSEALTGPRRAFRAQQADPANPPSANRPWSDVNRYRDQLAERLEAFVALTWADERAAVEGAAALDSLLRNRGHDLQWLGSRLRIDEPGAALRVWQGKRMLTHEEASTLAAELNVDAEDLRSLSRNVPIELRAQTCRPRYRPQVQSWASRQHLGEADARERIEERLLAIAARSFGDPSERWQVLLEDFLAEELGDPA